MENMRLDTQHTFWVIYLKLCPRLEISLYEDTVGASFCRILVKNDDDDDFHSRTGRNEYAGLFVPHLEKSGDGCLTVSAILLHYTDDMYAR